MQCAASSSPGIDITPEEARWYPEGSLAVDAMGYVGTISEKDLAHIDRAAYAGTAVIGKTGVEAAFEKQLHGSNGFRQILVDAQGRPVQKPGVFAKDLEMKAPTPGDDVILSLDLKVQKVAEAALAGQEGAVVALDPNSGDIIALVSSPGFDPNLFARGITEKEYAGLEGDPNRPLYDRALTRRVLLGLDHQAGPGARRAHRRRDQSRTSRSSVPVSTTSRRPAHLARCESRASR